MVELIKFARVFMLFTAWAAVVVAPVSAQWPTGTTTGSRLVTGKLITPLGVNTPVGSYPQSGILSGDDKYFLVSDSGQNEYLSAIRVADGALVSQLSFNGRSSGGGRQDERGPAKSLYFGLISTATRTGSLVYASGGTGGLVNILNIDDKGILTDTGQKLLCTDEPKPVIAGVALDSDGSTLYAADNRGDPGDNLRGTVLAFDTSAHTVRWRISVPGYPYAIAAITTGANADKKVYVTSEQQGIVSIIDPAQKVIVGQIRTGMQPIGLLLNRDQSRLFVANAGSDTVSVIDTLSDKVVKTMLMRPPTARGLPGATPIGLALSPDQQTLYVTLADMNAIAVTDVSSGTVLGYLPTGWYPTGIAMAPDGRSLYVTEARGISAVNPTPDIASHPDQQPGIYRGPLDILQGVATKIDLTNTSLKSDTDQVFENNLTPLQSNTKWRNPGIQHVIYIIKENRTYDQILGDVADGNGDKSLCMFPQDVTPNLHALAARFALLDNFYCCAEVSGDGWNWSTAGMASEYVSRNVPYSYGGRGRTYDYEGGNDNVAVNLLGKPDAAAPPGGYIWDECAKHHISQRNYGFFVYDIPPATPDSITDKPGFKVPDTVSGTTENQASEKTLARICDRNFRGFDLSYHDSDAWVQDHLPVKGNEKAKYGAFAEPSRYSEWKREFDKYVTGGNLPEFTMLRLMCDHTGGTRPGAESPRSQVADNDYALGEVVQAISKSPYWRSTVIVVVEDDAQSGYDHVDCHRSVALVISPFVERSTHDSRFYNTDSALKTIEVLMGLPPMSQYDSIASPFNVFGAAPDNLEPYTAILPDKSIIGERNSDDEYGGVWSRKNIDIDDERSQPDIKLNDVLWRSIMHSTPPPIQHAVQFGPVRKVDDD
jgi:DNA-binding beta-propeller fold protein YncE